MSDVMLTLGSFKFSITTAAYREFVRKSGWNWSASKRFGQHDRLQYTGPKNETISLSGVIYPEFENVGRGQPDKLRALGNSGTPQLLTSGLGEVMGYWCIQGFSENQPAHFRQGIPRKQTFQLEIVFYGKNLSNP